jgi:DNA polymerase-1
MRYLLVDGNHLAGRCRATMSGLSTSKGIPSGVIFGVLQGLKYARDALRIDWRQQIICWDGGRCQRRLDLYPEYKGNRNLDLSPEEIKGRSDYYHQLDALYSAIAYLGARQIKVTGMEADDAIGILVGKILRSKDKAAVIYSGDYDLHQLAYDRVSIFHPKKDGKKELLIQEDIEKHWGIPFDDIVKFKALVGDSSDNIKGVTGIGPVKAKRYINGLDETGKIASRIDNAKEIVARNVFLMRIPLQWESHVRYYGKEQEEQFEEQLLHSGTLTNKAGFIDFCTQWELKDILEKINSW